MCKIKTVRVLGEYNGHELSIVSYAEYGIMYGNKVVKHGLTEEQIKNLTLKGAISIAQNGIGIFLRHEEKIKSKKLEAKK